ALSMISIFFYRLIYSILMLILAVGSDTVEYSWQDFIPMFGWELFLTSVCTGVLYALLSLFFPSFRKNDMRII
ncbi:MAG TPA: hypothetical protein VEA18_00440, partial [Candidatus Kapabacteria bacterium]|nr:hypothetical protein [Candidatus Kapabacteria bacterium]